MLLELKVVLSGGNGQFLKNFSFIITSQHFHPTRIKMYDTRLFLQVHTSSISKKYCTDHVFKALRLLEWNYLKALSSPIFTFQSRPNSSFLISKTPSICISMRLAYSKHNTLQAACTSLLHRQQGDILLHELLSSPLPGEAEPPHNSAINTNTPVTFLKMQNIYILSPVTCKVLLNAALRIYLYIVPMNMSTFTCSTSNLYSQGFVFLSC